MDARRAAPRLRLAQPLPPWVTQRVVVIEPGEEASVVEPWWDDALVLVTRGSVELCGRAGTRRALPEGAVLWVDGLALRAVRNRGDRPAVLVAVHRRP